MRQKNLQVLTKFCKAGGAGYNCGMRPVFHTLSILVVLLSLNACRTTTSKQEPNVGPFDSHGRYVEAWADDPSKWRPYTPKDVEGDPPKIAKNEQPLDNSVPLATGDSPTSRAKSLRNGSDSTRQLSRNSTSKTKADTEQTAKKSSKSENFTSSGWYWMKRLKN